MRQLFATFPSRHAAHSGTRSRARARARELGVAPTRQSNGPSCAAKRSPEARVRASGGPEDRALYACGCGLAFTASVSTSVSCPHCGGTQAW